MSLKTFGAYTKCLISQVMGKIIADFIKNENGCGSAVDCAVSAGSEIVRVCVSVCRRTAAAVGLLAVSTSVRVKGTAPASEATWAMASIVGEAPTM